MHFVYRPLMEAHSSVLCSIDPRVTRRSLFNTTAHSEVRQKRSVIPYVRYRFFLAGNWPREAKSGIATTSGAGNSVLSPPAQPPLDSFCITPRPVETAYIVSCPSQSVVLA